MKIFHKIASFILSAFVIFWFCFATDPDSFLVEVNPSSFLVWESVDITVTAVKKDGTVVKDFDWDIFILIQWLSTFDYITPSEWWYTFLPSDQWVKLFSKGLKVNKAGTYKVLVSLMSDDDIMWESTIIVWNWTNSWNNTKTVDVTYPISWSTESKTSINIMWSASDLPNSPVNIYLNKSLVSDNSYTDSQWNFNTNIFGLKSWLNEIQVKIVDINWSVLWQSDIIPVNYKQISDGVFNSINIYPSSSIKQWEKTSIEVSTSEWVSSIELLLNNWNTYPMDRISAWKFSKDITVMDSWNFNISLSLIINWTTKTYSNVAWLFVAENIWVYNVKFESTWVDWTSIVITWDQLWNSPKYNILYWTQKDNLQKNVIVSSTWVLVENLQTETKYYFQIVPMDNESHNSWTPSEVFEYNPKQVYSSCVIQWIAVKSEKIWDKYYLIWDPVQNAVSYQVFRSDWKDMSSKTMVWETNDTRFEYYFNAEAEADQYAYYQIQATCADWSNVMIEDVEKVKVWPFENIMLIFVITWFVYCIYKLYRTIE